MVKILIMDDEPGLRNIVYNMLKPLGHKLFTAEDGKQAIEIGQRENPSLALLDMRVPDMDGLEVLNELKKINPNIKCIMLSGFGDVETAVGAIKQGAFDYLSKPFKIDEVIGVVNKALQSALSGGNSPFVSDSPAPADGGSPFVSAPASGSPFAGAESSPFGSGGSPFAAEGNPPPAQKASTPISPMTSAPVNTGALVRTLGIIGGVLLALAAVAFLGKMAVSSFSSKSRIPEYKLSFTNPSGMCWINANLWISDWVSGTLYQHNNDDKLSEISSFKTKNSQPVGLTYDGEFLWTCNSGEKRIYKHKIDNPLMINAIYALQKSNPTGLYFDGLNLWVLDSEASKIYRYKVNGTIEPVDIYDSPVVNPIGLFKAGKYYYLGDYKTSRLYKVSVSKGFSIDEIYALPGFDDGKRKIAGMAWDGSSLWVCAEETPKVFKYNMGNLKRVKA